MSNELRRRAVALCSVMLLASTLLLYRTARHDPATGFDAALLTSDQTKQTVQIEGDQVLPMITSALRNNDFTRARELTNRLPDERSRAALFVVVQSAEQKNVFQRVNSDVRRNRFAEARSAAAAVSSVGGRDEIEQIISFSEARHALNSNDLATATQTANALRPGVKRALLHVALADRLEAVHDRAGCLGSLRMALADADRVPANNRRHLLVMIARIFLLIDTDAGLDVLDRALHEHASGVAVSGVMSIGVAGGTFYEVVSAANSRYAFSLAVKGAEANEQELVLAHHGSLRCKHGAAEERRTRGESVVL